MNALRVAETGRKDFGVRRWRAIHLQLAGGEFYDVSAKSIGYPKIALGIECFAIRTFEDIEGTVVGEHDLRIGLGFD